MNEFELIARLTRTLPSNKSVLIGVGDDCAVLDGGTDRDLLFKTDAVVEGIHFTKETPPEKAGRKALARCLSDIAAMAGTPDAHLARQIDIAPEVAVVVVPIPSRRKSIDQPPVRHRVG